jgi:GDP-L-fucose synthase
LHVDDLADACYFLLKNYNNNLFVNVGTGEDLSIYELAKLVQKIVGFEGAIILDNTKPDGTPRKLMDVSRINQMGWKAKIDLETGIRTVYNSVLEQNIFA